MYFIFILSYLILGVASLCGKVHLGECCHDGKPWPAAVTFPGAPQPDVVPSYKWILTAYSHDILNRLYNINKHILLQVLYVLLLLYNIILLLCH